MKGKATAGETKSGPALVRVDGDRVFLFTLESEFSSPFKRLMNNRAGKKVNSWRSLKNKCTEKRGNVSMRKKKKDEISGWKVELNGEKKELNERRWIKWK